MAYRNTSTPQEEATWGSQGPSEPIRSYAPPSIEDRYRDKVSQGHPELLDFFHGKRSEPPSTLAPFYMGGAGSCTELIQHSRPIAETLYRYSQAKRRSTLNSCRSMPGFGSDSWTISFFHPDDDVDTIELKMVLGDQINHGCSSPFIDIHRHPSRATVDPKLPELTKGPHLMKVGRDLSLNDLTAFMMSLDEMDRIWPDEWRRKLNCQNSDCKQFVYRCQDLGYDAHIQIRLDTVFPDGWPGRCVNMSRGTWGHDFYDTTCNKPKHVEDIGDEEHMNDLDSLNRLQGKSPLLAEEAAEMNFRGDRRREIWTENHTGKNSGNLSRIIRVDFSDQDFTQASK